MSCFRRQDSKSIPLSFASEVLAVPKMNGKIAVDGNLAKYKEIKPIVLDSPKDIYPREATIPERALILNDGRDIRVELYAAWNRENLYLAAKVRDRSHRNNHDAENLWRGDSMQIGIVPGNLAWPVELNPDAVRDAVTNAKRNGITNARFFCADAGEFMSDMSSDGERADVVFMDPPRAGSDERFLSSVMKLSPKKIVYISCNPETQQRDLRILTSGGYHAERIQPVDMFPHTNHIETVVLLQK